MTTPPWFPPLVEPTAQAVRRGIASRVGSYVPEWAARRADDPGVALVKAFAEQAVILRRQLDRSRGQLVRAHLRYAGVTTVPAVPARVRLEVTLAPEADRTVTVPAGAQLLAPPPPGAPEPVMFETERSLTATSAVLAVVVVTAGRGVERRSAAELTAGTSIEPFGRRPAPGNAIWLGFAGGAVPDELALGFELRRRGQLAARAGTSGAGVAGPVIAWDATTEDGFQGVDVAEDSTDGLQQGGIAVLRMPRGWAATPKPDLDSAAEPRRWLRARLLFGQYQESPEITRILVNAVDALAVRTRREEVLEPIADPLQPGRPRFRLTAIPVVPGSVQLTVEGPEAADLFELGQGQGPALWEERPTLADSGPDDHHFVVDVDSGDILFGDGVHGARPPSGFRNVQALRYQVASGAGSRVGAKTPFTAVDNVPFLRQVTNPSAATGGYDAVPVDNGDEPSDWDLAAYGAATHRARGRAVIGADYEVLARGVPGGGVSRAIARPGRTPEGGQRPGAVAIIVVGHAAAPGEQPMPDAATLEAVARGLAATAPPGVLLSAIAPVFVPVGVRVIVRRDPGQAAGTLISAVSRQLDAYLDPITGGDDGRGWPLGSPILHRRLVTVVAAAEAQTALGVEGSKAETRRRTLLVESLVLRVGGRELGDCADGPLPWNGLPWPVGYDIVPVGAEAQS